MCMYQTCFCFCFMQAVIHALRCSFSFSSRFTHSCAVFIICSCVALIHALYSFMRCFCLFVALMHALYSFMRRTHSLCVTFIHALIHLLHLFMHCIHSHTPHAFMRCLLACFYCHSFIYHIHGLMPPSLFLLPVMYHVDLIEEIRADGL